MYDVSCSPEGISTGLRRTESTYQRLGACKADTHFCLLGKQAQRGERGPDATEGTTGGRRQQRTAQGPELSGKLKGTKVVLSWKTEGWPKISRPG